MLEIYNEQVRDLLTRDNPKGGLSVRQNPKLGLFYVEKLRKVAVGSYNEIERRMEEGDWLSDCLRHVLRNVFTKKAQRNNLVTRLVFVSSSINMDLRT